METNLRTLGPKEAKVILSLREKCRDVVHAADIIDLLGSEPSARKVIRNLLRKGWLTRLVGGRYMMLPPERGPENLGENNPIALAAAVVDPSYVGWWSAAAFHGFTTQKPMTVTVAVLRQSPMRTIEGTEVRFIKIAKRKFSGFKSYNVYGRNAAISDPEKTVVDCIDRPGLAGGVSELARILYHANCFDGCASAAYLGRFLQARLGPGLGAIDHVRIERAEIRGCGDTFAQSREIR